MSVATLQGGFSPLLEVWERADVPAGWKVEIIEGSVTAVPPPSNSHNLTADLLHEALLGAKQPGWGVYQTQALHIAAIDELYVPDLLVYPREALLEVGSYAPADQALLVAEITSPSNARHDRMRKLWGYAHGGVPIYLLVDPHATDGPGVTLYEEPVVSRGVYQRVVRVPFGETITVPEPFGLDIDTSTFPKT